MLRQRTLKIKPFVEIGREAINSISTAIMAEAKMQNISVVIREYQPQDVDSCKELWNELTQRHRDIYQDPSIGGRDPASYFELHLKRTDLAGVWVAETDSVVVGMAGLLINKEDAEIEPIVIRATHRSRGVGTQLIGRLKLEAAQREAKYLGIRPVARNAEAIQCFYRAGFEVLGHIEMFLDLEKDSDSDWMRDIPIHGCKFQF